MQKTLLILFSLFFTIQLSAQSGTCMPDTTVVDTTGGLGVIFPIPYDSTTMLGGIPVTACQNKPFEYVFTANVPAVIELEQVPIPLEVNFMEIVQDGVNGLPEGMTYACNPPDCKFTGGTFGCVVIYGTPTSDIGDYDLKLDLNISTSLLDTPSTEPGNLFPGQYILTLEAEDSPNCFVVGTSDVLADNLQFSAVPNPFGGYTQIQVNSGISQEVIFTVNDLMGKEIHSQPVQLFEGQNTVEFNGENLAEGMYIYSLRKDAEVISKKMILNR